MAYNKVILIGRLVRDAEVKYTQSGKPVATLTLAVDRPTAKGEAKEADFLPIVAWDKLGETIGNYTQKGSKILIEGRLQVRSYDNKEGKKVYVTEVIASKMEFLESRSEKAQAGGFDDMGTNVDMEIPF